MSDYDTLLDVPSLTQLEETLGAETMAELLTVFVEDLVERSPKLLDLIEAGDHAQGALEAHALKGSAGNFGALALAEHYQLVEDACLAAKVQEALTLALDSPPLIDDTVAAFKAKGMMP